MGDRLRTDVSHTMHTYKNVLPNSQPTKQQSPPPLNIQAIPPPPRPPYPSRQPHPSPLHTPRRGSALSTPPPSPPPPRSANNLTSHHDQPPHTTPTLRSPRLQLDPMPPRNLLPQHLIHQPMLPHHAQPREPARLDLDRVHGPAPARYVLHLHRQPVSSAVAQRALESMANSSHRPRDAHGKNRVQENNKAEATKPRKKKERAKDEPPAPSVATPA